MDEMMMGAPGSHMVLDKGIYDPCEGDPWCLLCRSEINAVAADVVAEAEGYAQRSPYAQ